MDRTGSKSLVARVREFFLLQDAERAARSFTQAQADAMRAYHAAGMRRLRVAQDLRGPEEVQTSLSLYRQATLFLAQAAILARDEHADVAGLTVASALEAATDGLPAEQAPMDLAAAVVVLSSEDPLFFDRMTPAYAGERAEMLERVDEWLAGQVDARTPAQLRTARVVRLASAGAVLVGLLVWAVVRITAPTNIAKGKPAVASSIMFASSADAVVDGVKEDKYGLHTTIEPNASFTVDLGAEYALTRVKVFGRGDGWFEQSVPLNLEGSKDGVTYVGLAVRAEPFSQADPWVVAPAGAVVRHLRLRTEKSAYLVLSEVEVFGKKKK